MLYFCLQCGCATFNACYPSKSISSHSSKRDQTSSSSHNDSALYGGFKLALLDLEFFWKMMHFYEVRQCILCTHGTPNVTCRLGQEFGHVDLVFCLKQKFMLKSYDVMLNSHSLFHVSKVNKPTKKNPPLSKAFWAEQSSNIKTHENWSSQKNIKTTNNFNLWVLRGNISFKPNWGFCSWVCPSLQITLMTFKRSNKKIWLLLIGQS